MKNIDSIIYYYNQKQRMNSLLTSMTNLYDKIYRLHKEYEKIKKDLNNELNGMFKEVYDTTMINGKYTVNTVLKKTKRGRLENLKEYLNEASEEDAISKYIKLNNIKINKRINVDDYLDFN